MSLTMNIRHTKWMTRKELTKMIINTGMRTDIPAFYSKWMINRIRDGYVLVRNPYKFLIGYAQAGDKIYEADQKSWLDMQMKMDI